MLLQDSQQRLAHLVRGSLVEGCFLCLVREHVQAVCQAEEDRPLQLHESLQITRGVLDRNHCRAHVSTLLLETVGVFE